MNILKSGSANDMADLGVRQLAMVLLSILMVLAGLLELAGELSAGPVLFAGVLLVLVFVSFTAGRLSASLW